MDVGLYGKLPTHGDFLRRRVPDDFVEAWDRWLQHCIAESRLTLGERWLDVYLTSPVWRFALSPRVCGAASVAGLIVPSVDRVGRYFPLTVVWPTPTELSTLEVSLNFRRGFEAAEQLLVDTLATEHFEFADFDERVVELSSHFRPPAATRRLDKSAASTPWVASGPPRCIPLDAASSLGPSALRLFGCQLDATVGAVALWWTDGSAAVEPSWLMTPGLPEPVNYTAMLDGAWSESAWQVLTQETNPSTTITRTARPDAPLQMTSAALTDRGPVRSKNQDAFIERPELGLWGVADGMGGLRDGERASLMVCDSLAEAPLRASLDEQVETVIAQLQEVNAHLRRAATRPSNPVESGSTVVVLLVRKSDCAILWAGDSRAYRLRAGVLSQLTIDHSWVTQGGIATGTADDQAITRAVGAEDHLALDVVRADVRPGDRYLLCSDGVGRVLDEALLRAILGSGPPMECARELIAESIALEGTDNMTAIVVDCREVDAP